MKLQYLVPLASLTAALGAYLYTTTRDTLALRDLVRDTEKMYRGMGYDMSIGPNNFVDCFIVNLKADIYEGQIFRWLFRQMKHKVSHIAREMSGRGSDSITKLYGTTYENIVTPARISKN